MFGIGAQELAIILVVALLVFGPKRLPELARTMGRGLAEFRRASTDLRQSIQLDVENDLAKERAAEIAEAREKDAAAGEPEGEADADADAEAKPVEAVAAPAPAPSKDTPGG